MPIDFRFQARREDLYTVMLMEDDLDWNDNENVLVVSKKKKPEIYSGEDYFKLGKDAVTDIMLKNFYFDVLAIVGHKDKEIHVDISSYIYWPEALSMYFMSLIKN